MVRATCSGLHQADRAGHVDLDDFRHAFSVSADRKGQRLTGLREERHEPAEGRGAFPDLTVACHAVGETEHRIVGARVSVHGDAVE